MIPFKMQAFPAASCEAAFLMPKSSRNRKSRRLSFRDSLRLSDKRFPGKGILSASGDVRTGKPDTNKKERLKGFSRSFGGDGQI